MKPKLAVFASGNGSNFQTIVDAARNGQLDAEITLLVSDKPDAKAVERAEEAGILTFVFSPKDYQNKAQFEQEILEKIKNCEISFIVLAGYMRLIGQTLLTHFAERIINIHPSLLPAFPGKDAIGQAFSAEVKITGVTIHNVDEGMDTGTIIAQEAVPVFDTDDRSTLQKRIQKVEHELYPRTLDKLLQQRKGNFV